MSYGQSYFYLFVEIQCGYNLILESFGFLGQYWRKEVFGVLYDVKQLRKGNIFFCLNGKVIILGYFWFYDFIC